VEQASSHPNYDYSFTVAESQQATHLPTTLKEMAKLNVIIKQFGKP
jgi:hypothetical protein